MHAGKTSGASALAAPIYSAMQSEHFRRAMDWVVEIGGRHAFLWVMYGCSVCQHYPVRSNSWCRVTRNVKDDQLGDTSHGAEVGFWHCVRCFARWSWAGGGKLRLVVFGDADSRAGFKPGYGMAYIASVGPVTENKIQFLRSGKALTVLDGKPVSREMLLQVIEECNQQVHCVFSKGVAEAVSFCSKVVPQHQLDQLSVHLVCEDRRLSMQRMGVKYLALDMSKQQLAPIDSYLFDFMLDASAAMMDFDLSTVSSQARKLAQRIYTSAGYGLARAALRALM
jgi:hypothetical protein